MHRVLYRKLLFVDGFQYGVLHDNATSTDTRENDRHPAIQMPHIPRVAYVSCGVSFKFWGQRNFWAASATTLDLQMWGNVRYKCRGPGLISFLFYFRCL